MPLSLPQMLAPRLLAASPEGVKEACTRIHTGQVYWQLGLRTPTSSPDQQPLTRTHTGSCTVTLGRACSQGHRAPPGTNEKTEAQKRTSICPVSRSMSLPRAPNLWGTLTSVHATEQFLPQGVRTW